MTAARLRLRAPFMGGETHTTTAAAVDALTGRSVGGFVATRSFAEWLASGMRQIRQQLPIDLARAPIDQASVAITVGTRMLCGNHVRPLPARFDAMSAQVGVCELLWSAGLVAHPDAGGQIVAQSYEICPDTIGLIVEVGPRPLRWNEGETIVEFSR